MQRQRFTAEFKAKVALESIKGNLTIAEIASKYQVHSTQIGTWKKQLLNKIPDIFSGKIESAAETDERMKKTLYEQIGKLQVENDFLKQAVYRS